MEFKCNICLNTENNVQYIGREMQFGTRDKFVYFKCAACGCLQIAEIPDSLGKYYPDNYYAYKLKKTSFIDTFTNPLIKLSIKLNLDKILPVYYLSSKYKKYHRYQKLWLHHIHRDSSILDIGCGVGVLLKGLQIYGYENLTGIDPYINKNISYSNNFKVIKDDIYSLNKQYDFVMIHHAFEHMPDPHKVFAQLNKITTDNGRILIRIPVVDGYVWRKYQMDWFQVDAPRHLFLHTIMSMRILADKSGLEIESIQYDSTYHQFSISEQIANDIAMSEMSPIERGEKVVLKQKTKKLNALQDGDQACFILKKKSEKN